MILCVNYMSVKTKESPGEQNFQKEKSSEPFLRIMFSVHEKLNLGII